MLVIKIELWPHGDEARRQTIATGVIVNDGTGSAEMANYDAHFANGDVDVRDVVETAHNARVENFLRGHGAWYLLRVALQNWYYRQSVRWQMEKDGD